MMCTLGEWNNRYSFVYFVIVREHDSAGNDFISYPLPFQTVRMVRCPLPSLESVMDTFLDVMSD
jgi:hypothetical protein